jgi:glutaredoxin
MNNLVVLYTMKGCPYCDMMKDQLVNENIDYYERDVNEYEEEHNIFVEITGNDYVPAFMIIEDAESETPKSHLFSPENDFNEITEGVGIIRSFMI